MFCFLITLFLSQFVSGNDLYLELVAPKALEALSGEFVTLSFRVNNHTGETVFLKGVIDLPPDINILTTPPEFTLEPGQSTINLLSLFLPPQLPADKYPIRYQIYNTQGIMQAQKELELIVLPKLGLEVDVKTFPSQIVAGEEYQVLFSIYNSSNIELQTQHLLSDNLKYILKLDAEGFILSPGQAKFLSATVKTDSSLNRKAIHWLTLEVSGTTASEAKITARTRARIDLLPRVSGVDDLYHRLPITIGGDFTTGGGIAEAGSIVGQFYLAATGPISSESNQWVDLFIRPPALRIAGDAFAEQPTEYRYSHWNDLWRLDIGDHRFTLSPLTESRFRGRGISVMSNFADFELGFYYRWDRDWENSGWASQIHYDPGDNWALNFGFLSLDNDQSSTSMFTLGSQFSLGGSNNFSLEYAKGLGDLTGQAFSADISGAYQGLSYNLGYLLTEADFPGRISDRESYYLNLRYFISRQFSLSTAYRSQRVNLDLIPQNEAIKTDHFEIKGRWRLEGPTLELIISRSLTEDQHLLPQTQRESLALEGVYSQTFDNLRLKAAYKKTFTEDLLTESKQDFSNFHLSLSYKPLAWQSYGLNYRVVLGEQGIKHWGRVYASFNLEDKFKLDLSFLREQQEDNSLKNVFTAGVFTTLPEQMGDLSFKVRHSSSGDRTSVFSVAAQYSQSINFGLPLTKRPVGRLSGRITDEIGGREGVIIKVDGFTAVSNAEGYFRFPDLEAGQYYLQVDRGTLASGEVVDMPMPYAFSIEAKEHRELELFIVEASSIAGQALVYAPLRNNNNNNNNDILLGNDNGNNSIILNQGVEMGPAYALSGLLIVLRNSENGEARFVFTDDKGSFNFNSLRPGQYELIVNGNNSLPRHHHLVEDRFFFNLTPGDNIKVEIKVFPKERELEFIDEGEVF